MNITENDINKITVQLVKENLDWASEADEPRWLGQFIGTLDGIHQFAEELKEVINK